MEERRMKAVVVQPNQPDLAGNDLEPPSAELVETLRTIMTSVVMPAGLRDFNAQEGCAIKEFACQLPISRGFTPGTLHLLHRIVVSHFAEGTTTTVDWPMLVGVWSGICERGNRTHLVEELPSLLKWCFEPSSIRVIGLCELEWHPADRAITIRTHRPNFTRMAAFLNSTFNLEVSQQPVVGHEKAA
jgi:hypothetical protein